MGKHVLALPGCSLIVLMAPTGIDVKRPLPVPLTKTVRIPAASELEVMANVDYDVNTAMVAGTKSFCPSSCKGGQGFGCASVI